MTAASIFVEFWDDQLVADGKQGIFLVLVGFLLSFGFIRMSTRLMRSPRVPWWPGSVVSDSGVHVHHLVFGIVTMMVSGTLGFARARRQPLHRDLRLRLRRRRRADDRRVRALGLPRRRLLGRGGTQLDRCHGDRRRGDDAWSCSASARSASRPSSIEQTLGSLVAPLIVFGLVAVCFAKQRVLHGTVGFFFFPVAIYGACRIGKPGSPWARRRYGERRPEKQAKAEDRFHPERRTERFKEAFRDIVGGKPSEGVAAASQEALAATREAAEEVRQRAERSRIPAATGERD